MKGIRILLGCLILCLIFPKIAYAEEITSEKEPVDIVFVIDSSGSMRTNDSSKMALNMVQAFIDTAQNENIRIGYVAYNDSIVAYSGPESIMTTQERDALKDEIGAITYSDDTDIGLGISYAYDLLSAEQRGRQIIVLISDGETDLPRSSERTEEQSNQELKQCVSQCVEDGIQIYTVAFGQYDGNKETLEEIASQTGAKSYLAQQPEDLIEILYGIFQDNLIYKIQKFSSGTYAGGNQEIKCVLDAPYLDEINILLLSSETVGDTVVQYGDKEVPLVGLSRYAVGKIENMGADSSQKELIIRSETEEKQDLQIYLISYRELTPILQLETKAERNQELEYQVYFKDRNNNIIRDANFYETFLWEIVCDNPDMIQEKLEISEGVIKGKLCFAHSGIYELSGTLRDEFGSFSLPVQIEVTNTMPSGSIPEEKRTILKGEYTICLDDYFKDGNQDPLSYSITEVADEQKGIAAQLDGNVLKIVPREVGKSTVTIQISEGENAIQYDYRIRIIPLWQEYWWVLVSVIAILALIIWKICHKPKPELERITEEKKQNHFCGRLDAYFVLQPQDEEEIPPLSFQMNKIKDGRVSLGSLFGMYPDVAELLQLEEIFLIADENRNMILYHRTKSGVMVGSTIACMQIQYQISFGDIIYITSPDGRYDLEIHYVAVFQ